MRLGELLLGELLLEAGARAKVEWLPWIDPGTLAKFLPQLTEALDVDDDPLDAALSWAEGEGYMDLARVLEKRLAARAVP